MSRTIRRTPINWSIIKTSKCMSCNYLHNEYMIHCNMCNSFYIQYEYSKKLNVNDGKANNSLNNFFKTNNSNIRRSTEIKDLYNCINKNDFEYIDTESYIQKSIKYFL